MVEKRKGKKWHKQAGDGKKKERKKDERGWEEVEKKVGKGDSKEKETVKVPLEWVGAS